MTSNFLRKIFLNNISQGLQFGSRWFLSIILLKTLSINMFAVFSFVFSISNFMVAILPFGSPVYLINKSEQSKKGYQELANSISIILFLFFVSLVTFLTYIVLVNPQLPNKDLIPLGLVLSLILSINAIIFSFIKGIGNFSFELKIFSVFSLLVLLLCAYLYFVGPISVMLILLILIFVNALMLRLAMKFSSELDFKQLYSNINLTTLSLKNSFYRRFYFGLQEIVTAIYSQGGMLILFYVISNKVYGEYRALLILIAPFALVNVAVSQVLLSHLKSVPTDKIRPAFRKLHFPFSALLLVGLLGIYFFGEPIIKLITGLEYNEEIQKSLVCILTIIFTSFLCSGYEMMLVLLNKQKQRFYIMLAGALTNIISIVLLLPKFGLFGAIMTNTLSNIVVFILIIIVAERHFSKQDEYSNNNI